LVIEHLPIAGHSARSTPGVVQAALVIEQLPGTFAQGTCELHAAWVLAQVPIDEQSLEPRHRTLLSLAHLPMISGQVPGFTLHTEFGGLLQVPVVRHCRLASACVAPLHGCCDHGWPFCFEQVPGVVGQFAAEPQSFWVHAWPPQLALDVHAVVPFGQVFCAQVPPVTAGQLAPAVQALAVHASPPQSAVVAQTVVPLGQVVWLHAPLIVVHCATEVQAWPGGLLHVPQSAAEMQTLPVLVQANCGQSLLLEQVCAGLRLQCPPRTAQSLTEVHRLPRLLQWPMSTQSDCPMQALPLTLHAPACGTQLAFDVHERPVWIEHLPGSGVHTGFGQFWTGVQVFSGLGGSSSQPGGS
jgi:hypothetical protein